MSDEEEDYIYISDSDEIEEYPDLLAISNTVETGRSSSSAPERKEQGNWSCARCTFEVSEGSTSCPMCEYTVPIIGSCSALKHSKLAFSSSSSTASEAEFDISSGSKSCPRCTVVCASSASTCLTCDHRFQDKCTTQGIGKKVYHKRQPWCKFCKVNDHWTTACQEKALADENTLTTQTYTEGVVDLLKDALSKQHKDNPTGFFHLCSPCSYITQKGTEGAQWSCGYRNIQMLCSALVSVRMYREVLFDGSGEIPSVHGIQSWIERAWVDGFDPEGACELSPLLGTNTWIGASECAALLRYFNIRATVVDFGLELGKYTERCDHHRRLKRRPFDTICDLCREPIITLGGKSYFCGYCDYDECCKCREKSSSDNAPFFEEDLNDDISVVCGAVHTAPKRKFDKFSKSVTVTESRVSKQLHQWLIHYFTSQWDHSSSEEDFRPPIYFQHDGHSRTIVGLEEFNEKKNLILFDPAGSGSILYKHLIEDLSEEVTNARWKALVKRGLHTMTKRHYQIVFIKPGLMSKSERETSKLLMSEEPRHLNS